VFSSHRFCGSPVYRPLFGSGFVSSTCGGRADRWLELLVLRALGCIARGSVLLAKSRFGEKTDAPNCCRSNSAWFIDRSIVAFLLADRDHLLDVCAQLLISRNITLRFHVKFFSSVRPVTVKLSE
jgi:hypothetical protein